MRAYIELDGTLVVEADNSTEGYALSQWFSESNKGLERTGVKLKPTLALTLGPQKIEMLPAKKEGE